MSFDRAKILAEGGTYHGADNPLIEQMDFLPIKVELVEVQDAAVSERMRVVEGADPIPGIKRMVMEGVYQRADVLNANKRIYPRSIWERVLAENSDVQKRICDRAMIGHLEHPESGTTDLNKGALLVLEARLQEDGTIYGKALVYNTPEGLRLQEYLLTGTRIGISSRGTGTVNNQGVVQEDYALDTWDAVYNPSTPGANPKMVPAPATAGRKSEAVSESTTQATTGKTRMDPKDIARIITESETKVRRATACDPAILSLEERAKKREALLVERVEVQRALEEAGATDVSLKLVAELDTLRDKLGENIALPPSAEAAAAALGTQDLGVVALGLAALMTRAAATNVGVMDSKLFQGLVIYGTRLGGAHAQIGTATGAPVAGPGSAAGAGPKTEQSTTEMLGLLQEARDHVAKLSEEQEASRVMIESLQAANEDAGKALSTALAVLADLTSVDRAGQVREAVDRIVGGDKRLTAFRETLLQQDSPSAVEAKATEIVKTIEEQAARPDVTALATRIKRRSVAESALPAPGSKAASREDAGVLAPEPTESGNAKTTGVARGLATLKRVLPKVQESVGAR